MHAPLLADPASFRDPAGRVYYDGQRVLRSVSVHGAQPFEAVWHSGVLQRMAQQGRLVASVLVDAPEQAPEMASHWLEHPRLPLISYPYEWSFEQLKAAALAHLSLHLALLEEGFTLSDASAFNMQFIGIKPVHIDVLSVVPYDVGMRWGGYRQFLQHFLNPLLLESYTGVSFAPFFRSGLDGVASDDLLRLLPMPACLRPAVALHVWLPTLAERRVHSGRSSVLTPLPKARYIGLLRHMQTIIEGLVPRHRGHWRSYTLNTSYSALESEKKLRVVADFMQTHRPACLLDVGCNKGQYAAWALQHGARHVVGYDADRAAAGAAFTMASAENLSFVPLTVDIANPSPAQGWQGSERASLASRVQADAMMALALVHHLAIARNIPLAAVIEQLVALAPRGLIEFVPKQDRQVIELLQHREDIFPDYHYDAFIQALGIRATVVSQTPISESGRMLVEFERFA